MGIYTIGHYLLQRLLYLGDKNKIDKYSYLGDFDNYTEQ